MDQIAVQQAAATILLTLSTTIVRKSTRPTNHIAVPPSHSCCCMCADVWGEISSLLNRPAPTKLKPCRLHTLVCIDDHPARNQAEEGEVGQPGGWYGTNPLRTFIMRIYAYKNTYMYEYILGFWYDTDPLPVMRI